MILIFSRFYTRILLLPVLFFIAVTRNSFAADSATTKSDITGIPTLWLIGDSTVRNGADKGGQSQWGWGHPIASFFDSAKIKVQNRAHGGTSSRTYFTGDWPLVLPDIQPGDYVIMQFGHNDGSALNDNTRARGSMHGNGEETTEIDNDLTHRHEVVHTYGWYIRKFISDAKAKGAVAAIVCSPIPRNTWANGKIIPNANYTLWASQAAKEANTPFINLNEIINEKYDALGQQYVTQNLFPPNGEHTHPNWKGAVLNAKCVVEGIKALDDCDLKKYLLTNPPDDLSDPNSPPK